MHRMQNGGTVKMGPFSELNYETASKVSWNVIDVHFPNWNHLSNIPAHQNDIFLFDASATDGWVVDATILRETI